ncbi:hypothetical protein EMPG_09901 [Blastomyces silverae]|uniref:Uncharacterized protein n=1 Tax=Blastomyces silverae TaxID=2060906 RepID=A0A0H1BF30_9EURO|nr:hypothetical protein EMPG_09901 [Blastomyces silverae]
MKLQRNNAIRTTAINSLAALPRRKILTGSKTRGKLSRCPFVPMGIEIINYGKAGNINAKVCTEMMARLISGCIAQKASRLDYFRGGTLSDGSGWDYHIYCDADYCWT